MSSKDNIRSHTLETKLEALRILAVNDFNFMATERQIRITRKTLKKWQDELCDHPVIRSKQAQAINDIAKEVIPERISLLKKIEEVNIKALDKAVVLIEKETNLDKITNLIIALKDITDNVGNNNPQSKKSFTIAERIERITQINHE